MLSSSRTSIKQRSLNSPDSSALPCFDDCPLLSVATDVVPEERRSDCGIISFVFHEVCSICIQLCICVDGFILSPSQSTHSKEQIATHSHGAIISFMTCVAGFQTKCSHEVVFGNSRSNSANRHGELRLRMAQFREQRPTRVLTFNVTCMSDTKLCRGKECAICWVDQSISTDVPCFKQTAKRSTCSSFSSRQSVQHKLVGPTQHMTDLNRAFPFCWERRRMF